MSEVPLHEMRSSRLLPPSAERALNAALTRGHGYEPIPMGTAFDERSVRGYYIDFRSKTRSPTAERLDVLPAIQLIQLTLGWWERHVAGEPAAAGRFMDLCELVIRRAEHAGDELRWPIRAEVPKYRLAPGWCSALSQSQGASVLVRAYLHTRDDRYADLAARAVRPLTSSTASDLVTQTSAGPILEEAPSVPPSHILNGWMAALWGLWDVHVGLGAEREGATFQASLACLVAHLDSYDTGWWTLYSLHPHAVEDLAKPFYQRLHVDQLEVLHRLSGRDVLAETARRWRAYDVPSHRALAVGQKLVFALTERRRRQRWRDEGA